MTKTEFSIDSRSSLKSQSHNLSLLDYISGELDNESLAMLEAISSKESALLDKLILKCERQGLVIKAQDFKLMVTALNLQANLSAKIIPTIHAHLLDSNINNLAEVLNMLVANLQDDLPATDVMQSIMQVIDNLDIFDSQNNDEQFIKSIIILMISFHTKQTNRNNHYLDSAKWLKSLLAISQKSSLIQLIDYIAIRLALVNIEITGSKKNMQLTELFCIFDEITDLLATSRPVAENKKVIRDINASILIMMLCKTNPHTIVDVTAHEFLSADESYLDIENNKMQSLNEFMASENFKSYYKSHPELVSLDSYAFLENLAKLLTAELISNSHLELQGLSSLLENCYNSVDALSASDFQDFLVNLEINDRIVESFHKHGLSIILKAQQNEKHTTESLAFIATKLVNLGFSPRSTIYSDAGLFQPMIVKNKATIDQTNIRSLSNYLDYSDHKQRKTLIKDIIVTLIVRNRQNPLSLENQPKPMPKRTVDNSYPIPTVHHYTRTKATSANHASANNGYPLTFFAKSYSRTATEQLTNDEVEGQQYGQ